MKRSTRRSTIVQLPPADVVEEKRIAGSSFDTKFSLPSFTRRVEKLTDDQRAAISRTGFGNLLSIHNQMISKVLLNELIERWDREKMAFNLLHGEVTITPQDVALILGLRVIGEPVELDAPFSDLEQEYGATPTNRKINISVLEERLESMGGSVNGDFIRSFLLFTFGVFLFPNSTGKVDSRFLTLLKDLDTVDQYAWGEAVRQDLFSWINRRKEENVRWVGGCLLLLQVWSYEHIDIGRPNLLVSGQFPRASRWESIRSSYQRQWLSTRINKLEEDQITWVLHPTTMESEIDVVKHFLEAENAKEEEVLVGESSDSGASVAERDDSVVPHPEANEVISVQCATNIESDTEVDFSQMIISDSPDAALDVPLSCMETRKNSGKGIYMDTEHVSVDHEEECRQSSSLKLGIPLQTQDQILHQQQLDELKKENATLKEEIGKLKAENEDLKKELQQVDADVMKFDRMCSESSEYTFYFSAT